MNKEIVINWDSVIVCGKVILRPPRIDVTTWIKFWQVARGDGRGCGLIT
jgi:hypothetical protein